MENSRVVVEAVESIDLHQVSSMNHSGRSPRTSDRDDQLQVYPVSITANPPTHVAQGCLRIALQPSGNDDVVEVDRVERSQEHSAVATEHDPDNDMAGSVNPRRQCGTPGSQCDITGRQCDDPGRQCNKDEALSIVIQKLTEIVNGNKQQQSESDSCKKSSNPTTKDIQICQTEASSKTKEQSKQTDVQNLYKCPECPCLFAVDPVQLLGKTLPKCPCCQNRTGGNANSGDDMYLVPEPELKEYKCNLCEFKTPEKSMFYAHLRTHPDDVYKCALCDYATTMKNLMTRHQRSHEVSRKYKCNQCEFVTMELSVLQAHLKTHNQTQELMLKCSECGYSCKCEEVLRDHMWKHIDKIAPKGVVQLQKDGQSVENTSSRPNSDSGAVFPSSLPQNAPQTRQVPQPAPSLFKCLLCGYVCEKLCTLKAHAWRHAGEEGCSYPVIEELFSAINQPNQISNSGGQPTMSTCCGQTSGKNCCGESSVADQCQCQPVNVNPKQFPVIERLVSTAYARKYYPAVNQAKPPEVSNTGVAQTSPDSSEQRDQTNESQVEQMRKRSPAEQKLTDSGRTVSKELCTEMTFVDKNTETSSARKGTSVNNQQLAISEQNDAALMTTDNTSENKEDPRHDHETPANKHATPKQEASKSSSDDVNKLIIETRTSLQQLISDTVEHQIGKDRVISSAKDDRSKRHSVRYAVEHRDLQEAYQTELLQREKTNAKSNTHPGAAGDRQTEVLDIGSGNESTDNGKGGEQRLVSEKVESASSSGVSCSNLLASLLQKSQQEGSKQRSRSTAEPKKGKGSAGQGSNALESLIAATLAGLKSQGMHVSGGQDKQKEEHVPHTENSQALEAVPFVPPVARKNTQMQTQAETDQQKNCPNYNPDLDEPCVCTSEEVVGDEQIIVIYDHDVSQDKPQPQRAKRSAGKGMVTRSKRRKSGAVSPAFSDDSNESNSSKQGGISSSLLTVIERMRDNPDESREEIMEKLQQTSASITSDRDRETVDLESLIETVNVPQPLYQCKLCQYFSANKGYVKQHMRIHKERIPYKCPLCDFIGDHSEDLQEHMMDHCKQRTYQCKECSATFYYKSQLKAHVRGHNENVPFQCETCDYETCNSATFKAHLKTHTTNRIYTCYACSMSFKQRYLLRQHKLECEMNQTYSCQECDFTADTRENLEKHRQVHVKPYKCEICDYTSATISGVKNHMKFHASDKPYKCQYCDFAGPYPQSLRSHMKKHYGEVHNVQQMEQYKCNLCGYICSHLPSLKSHMWRHASEPNYNYDATNDVINAALDFESKQHTSVSKAKDDRKRTAEKAEQFSEQDSQSESQVLKKQNRNKGFEYSLVTFRCSQCGYEGIDKAALTEHMKTHIQINQSQGVGSTDKSAISNQQDRQSHQPLAEQHLGLQPQQQLQRQQDQQQAENAEPSADNNNVQVLNTLESLADGVERCPEPDVIGHQEEVVATEN
ncbi:LOW QUALITY PROTEIN: zinc finger protein 507-like [Ptychodera flava]|uniref:LOW QUALITY PROTEIN: zinc finger protein 507-like n=1 Tax=Ptychodera flava TaxID=63121 RepID=UPI00396A9F99